MSEVLDYIRSQDQRLKDVPDEELALFVADTHPEFLRDEQFASDVYKLTGRPTPGSAVAPVTEQRRSKVDVETDKAAAAWGWGTTKRQPVDQANAVTTYFNAAKEMAGDDPALIKRLEEARRTELQKLGVEPLLDVDNPLKTIAKPVGQAVARGTKVAQAAIGDLASVAAGMPAENLKSFANAPDAPLPIEEQVKDAEGWWRRAAGYLGLSGAAAPVFLGGAAGLTAAGVPPIAANAAMMGVDAEGHPDPVGVAAAFGLPIVDQWGREMTSKALQAVFDKVKVVRTELEANPGKFVAEIQNQGLLKGLQNDQILKAIEIGGGQLADNAYLLALQTPGILSSKDPKEALTAAVAGNLAMALMGAPELKGGGKSITYETLKQRFAAGQWPEGRVVVQPNAPAQPTLTPEPAKPPPPEPPVEPPPAPPAPETPAPETAAPTSAARVPVTVSQTPVGTPDPIDPDVTLGRPTTVRGANESQFPAFYAWVPAEKIQGSHLPGFATNPKYAPLENTRRYDTDPAEQEKVVRGAVTFDPSSYATNVRSAADGPIMVSRAPDGQYRILGGNGRWQMIQSLTPEQVQEFGRVQDEEAATFGLPVRPGPNAVLVRLLPPTDLASAEGLANAKRVVDLLNPSPGLVETTASMARNDSTKIPLESVMGIPADPSPAKAREWMAWEMKAGRLDRNTRRQILDTDSQLVDYAQRVRLHRAYGEELIVETAQAPKTSEATRALIQAPVPTLLALRKIGESKLPAAITEMVLRVNHYIDQGLKLDLALQQAGDQAEMFRTPESELARALAVVMGTQVELLEPNKRGQRKIDFEQTRDNFRTFFDRMASAVQMAQAEPDLLGNTRTPSEAVQDFLRLQMGDAPVIAMDGTGKHTIQANPAVVRLNRLTEMARRRRLAPKEESERIRLEAKLGPDFMRFWTEQQARIQQFDSFPARESKASKGLPPRPVANAEGATYEVQFGSNDNRASGPTPPPILIRLGHLDKVRPAEMPELVKLAKALMGHVPVIRKLPQARGLFKAAPGHATIKLAPQIFQNPIRAAKTLAHEIGHLIDFLPEETMARGNLFGRIGSLIGWLKTTFPLKSTTPISEVLTSKDRAAIRRTAENKVGARPPKDEEADLAAWQAEVSRVYAELIDEEIERRGLAKIDVVRQELWTLSQEWRPMPEGEVPESYLQYRQSGPELYADALSVLLNSPGFLEETAPTFWSMFWEYIDRKPEVRQELFDLQSLLAQGKIPTIEARRADVNEMFAKGEDKMRQAAEQRELRRRSFKGWWAELAIGVVDRNYAARAKAQQAGDERTVQVLDELGMRDNVNMALVRQVFETVIQPAEEAGFTIEQLGDVLFMERIISGDRSVLANPLGHTPLTARADLWKLRQEIGLGAWTELKRWLQTFHDITFKVMERAVESGVHNRETFETIVRPNKDAYAAFAVVDYLEDHVPPAIHGHKGTLKDVANPLVATLYKMVAVNNLIAWNNAKTQVRDMLLRHFPGEIKPAEEVGPVGARRVKEHPDFGSISPLVDGKAEHWYVDPYIAQAFEEIPPMHLGLIARMLDVGFRRTLYPLLITYNPGFLFITSPIREVRRTGRNLPVHFGRVKLLREYARVWHDVVERFGGNATPLTRELEGTLALATPFDAVGGFERGDAIGRLMERYQLAPAVKGSGFFDRQIFKPIQRLAKGIEFWGMVIDSLPKYGAYNILRRELRWSPKEAAGWVRTYAGLPNIKNKGRSQAMTRALIPFWNVFTQGWRADIRLMRSPKTRGGYWLRWALSEGMWTMMQALAASGLLGAALKSLYDGVSEYKKTNYTVVPMGTMTGGDFGQKIVYLQIPRDETDRVLSGMVYKLISTIAGGKASTTLAQDLADMFSFGAGQVPGMNPLLTIGSRWMDYARNVPPIDPLTGRPIIPTREWNAGGIDSLAPMANWTLAQGRMNIFGYDTKQDRTIEMVWNALPIGGRFVQITDYGYREQQRSAEQATNRRDAKRVMSYSDEVRGLIGEYNHLRGLEVGNRTEAQQRRLLELAPWYNSTYRPADEEIERAEAERDTANANYTRRRLNDSAKEFKKR